MNRPIKFRAWDKERNQMRLVTAINWYDEYMWVDETPMSGDRLSIEGTPLMQFTGLHDKNGKEIMESDLVAEDESVMSDAGEDKPNYIEKRIDPSFKYADGKTGKRRYGRKVHEVRWDDKSCGFEPFSDSEDNCGHCGGGLNARKVEVIGNIYENPELINQRV